MERGLSERIAYRFFGPVFDLSELCPLAHFSTKAIMTMGRFQRALIRKKLESQKVDGLSPSKFAGTSFQFGEDEDESSSLLSKCEIEIDQSSAAVSADAPKTPFVVKNSNGDSKKRDDDEILLQFDEVLKDCFMPPSTTTAGTHLSSPVHATVPSSTPPSMLHGIAISDDEGDDMDEPAHAHVTRTPKTPATTTIYTGRLFESSPLTQPDDSGMQQGLSFVDSLNYSVNSSFSSQPTPLHKMRSSPTMFQSSPLTSQPDDSLLQQSMSSFIGNPDDSILTVERELFDSITKNKKKTPIKTLYDDNKSDLREAIQLTAAYSFKGSLQRANPLLKVEDEYEEENTEDDFEIMSKLGLDTSLHHESKQQQPPSIKKDDLLHMKQASSSPSGVMDFHPDEDFSSLPPPPAPPAAPCAPKTSLISRIVDQAFSGCAPLGLYCSNEVYIKKQQQQPAAAAVEKSWDIAHPTSSSMKRRPGLVQRDYSPGEELSWARQNAYIAQQMSCKTTLKVRGHTSKPSQSRHTGIV